jgi:hypothetical protein
MFVAVRVYDVAPSAEEGVPLITPVEVFNTNPAGRGGETVKVVGVTPVTIGVSVSKVPWVNIFCESE